MKLEHWPYWVIIAWLVIGSVNLFIAHYRLMSKRLDDHLEYLNNLTCIELEIRDGIDYLESTYDPETAIFFVGVAFDESFEAIEKTRKVVRERMERMFRKDED